MDSVLLDSRSPAPALAPSEGLLHLDSFTPSRKTSANKDTEEIIVWDDDPPSSPFVSEVADSRIASGHYKRKDEDPEINAIFEDQENRSPERLEKPTPQANRVFSMGEQKENMHPISLDAAIKSVPGTPQKPAVLQENENLTETSLRKKDAIAMPPPSVNKRAPSTSPRKTPSNGTFGAVRATPVPLSRGNSYESTRKDSVRRERDNAGMFDDMSMAQEETNIDDTCFSTFSAVPEMTLFARLGEDSPSRNQQSVCVGPSVA